MIEPNEVSKVPVTGLVLHLNGSILEMIRRPNQIYEYKTIDLSRFDIELNGTDSEGFLRMKIIPKSVGQQIHNKIGMTEGVELDLKRRRIDNVEVKLPPGFAVYEVMSSSQGSKYEIYKNQGLHFLLKVKTKYGRRLHNLGDLDDQLSHISKVADIFLENRFFSKENIKSIMRDRRIYDGQKMAAELVILQREGRIVKNEDNQYARVGIDIN